MKLFLASFRLRESGWISCSRSDDCLFRSVLWAFLISGLIIRIWWSFLGEDPDNLIFSPNESGDLFSTYLMREFQYVTAIENFSVQGVSNIMKYEPPPLPIDSGNSELASCVHYIEEIYFESVSEFRASSDTTETAVQDPDPLSKTDGS